MKTQRILSEDEINEQIGISLKKELLAYIKDSVPRSQKTADMIEIWKQHNTELQVKEAALNRYARILHMLPTKERIAEINKLRRVMLPANTPAPARKK